MKHIYGVLMAGGLILGHVSVADAQFSLSIGNPFYGTGIGVGQPYGLGLGTTSYYSSGYVAPGTTYFGTGTVAPYAYPYSYGVGAPVVPYGGVGLYPYRNYGYYRRGFGVPFLGRRRYWR